MRVSAHAVVSCARDSWRLRERTLVPALLAAWLAVATTARAQDFAPAAPAGPQPGAAALLEHALPAGSPGPALETAVTRWLGFTAFETRHAAAGLGAHALRVALGVAQTGDPDLGWSAAALAVGACGPEGGAALRALARRDRNVGPLARTRAGGDAFGLEAGAGAWLAPAPGVALWASAPQLATGGEAPPLVRPLQLGARWTLAGGAAWLALTAPRTGDDGERLAGLALARGALTVWAEARDGPLRAALGVCAALGPVHVAAEVDAHPVLGETTRLGLAWRPARDAARGAGR